MLLLALTQHLIQTPETYYAIAPLLLAGIAGAPALLQTIGGLFGQHKANRAIKNNPFQVEKESPLYAQNLAIAEQAARVGLPQQQYNQARQNIGRNTAAALRQGLRAGRGISTAGIVRAANDATLGLDVADAQARMANQRLAYGMRNNLAQERSRLFDVNNRRRYEQQAQANAQQLGAAKSNIFAGLNSLSQLGMYAAGGMGGGGGSMMGTSSAGNVFPGWSKYNPYQ